MDLSNRLTEKVSSESKKSGRSRRGRRWQEKGERKGKIGQVFGQRMSASTKSAETKRKERKIVYGHVIS
jgi:hypothetical protein